MPGYGFDGTLDESREANRLMRGFESASRHVVWSGGDVTPGTGLAVNVSAVDGHACGVWFTDVAQSVALDANTSSNPRRDFLIVEVNWAATATALGTPANGVAVQKITGTPAATPLAPQLTQSAGSRWQVPLAKVRVPAGAGTISAANIATCKPLTRDMRIIPASDIAAQNFGANATNRVVSSAVIPDPGWSYYLDFDAAMVFAGDSGYARMRVFLDDTQQLATTKSGAMTTTSGDVQAQASRISPVLTGAHTLTLTVSSESVGASQTFSTTGQASSYFDVRQIPAPALL